MHNYKGFSPDEVQNGAVNKAVAPAWILGGKGVKDMEKVKELLEAHSAPLMDNLEELTKSASKEEDDSEVSAAAEEEEGLTLENLSNILWILKDTTD